MILTVAAAVKSIKKKINGPELQFVNLEVGMVNVEF